MEKTRLFRPWVVGGDRRYHWTVKKLRQQGLPVDTYGVSGFTDEAENLEAALKNADLLILPLLPFQGEDLVIGEERIEGALLPGILPKGATVIAGAIPDPLADWYQRSGIMCMTFLDLESYQMANAAVTAEGALELALEKMEGTLHGAKVLIIGWGRIGKFLGPKLKMLGADVTVSSRSTAHRTQAAYLGFRSEETGVYKHGLGEYDVIFNTVPAAVMTERQFDRIAPHTLAVELASLPGGYPQERAERVLIARGLPGKTAPKTAGEIVAEAVWACLGGEGRNME